MALPLDEHQRIVSVFVVLHLHEHFRRPIGDNELDVEHLAFEFCIAKFVDFRRHAVSVDSDDNALDVGLHPYTFFDCFFKGRNCVQIEWCANVLVI